ncbi:MAG: type III pantothenate kinase, partial [Oceanospirillaceae bacterium]
MLLAIDIGNTDAVFGFFENEELLRVCRIKAPKEESSLLYYDSRFRNYLLENGLQSIIFEQVVISSVVPELTDLFVQIATNFSLKQPIVINSASYDKVKVLIDNPQELGSDLFANAVAAYDKYAQNCIIVDFGTALTFTVVSDNAEVLGVAIAPGLKTAMNSLFSKTAQLPEVPLELPAKAIGTNSIHSIQSGILFGYEGLVRNMLKRIKAELGGNCKIIATGGLSSIIKALNDEFDEVDRNLTLNGIRI